MNHAYAREKLNCLLRDLDRYTADEFWREMSRIASGATAMAHAEDMARPLAELFDGLKGCGDTGCYIQPAGNGGTNKGCRCHQKASAKIVFARAAVLVNAAKRLPK